MAATETIILDATASNVDGTNPGSPLTIAWGTNYRLFEHEYPAPDLSLQWAGTVDTEGSLPASRKYENREIRLRFKLVKDAATGTLIAALRAKFAKFQAEGGTLKRTMTTGDVRIYDVLAGNGWNPAYNFDFYVSDLMIVEMTLQARPFSRGPEVDLGDNVETTLPVLVFTETGVAGDVPGLGRLVIDEDGGVSGQRTVLWGIESRYYSSASSAALFFQAEAQTAINASAAVGPAGASGSGSNTMRDTTLPAAFGGLGDDAQFTISSTHVGSSFRVIARVQVPATNTGTVSVRLEHRTASDPYQHNPTVTIDPAYEGAWVLVDLGIVSFRVPYWNSLADNEMTPQAISTVAGDDVYWDWVMLIPGDEGSGQAGVVDISTECLRPGEHLQVSHRDVAMAPLLVPPTVWSKPPKYEGDYLLIPPAGPEARTVRVIVKASRGQIINYLAYDANNADAGIDDISARLYVTPRYLT